MSLLHCGVGAFNLIIGGADIKVKFPLKNLLQLEDRESGDDMAEVKLEMKPSAINFPPNKCVTNWVPIVDIFRDIHTTLGAIVRWDSKQVVTRFRFRSNTKTDSTSKPTLLLEALVLPSGTMSAIPDSKLLTLSNNASSAILLWSQDCVWYSPLPAYKLPTAPGISRQSLDIPLPTETNYRWFLQTVLRKCDDGKSVESREEFEAYLDKPYYTKSGNTTTCWLPDPFSNMTVNNAPGTSKVATPCISFVRNGKVINRSKASTRANAKFNCLPKGSSFCTSSLPSDAPPRLRSLAGSLFNASIASSTARSYATAAAHVSKLEGELGRKLTWPLNPEDSNLLLIYLMDKGIQPSSVKQYLAGTRRLAMSKGVMTPAPPSTLAKTLLKGYENICRDPRKAVAEATHRPVTIPFLRLIGHSANTHWKGELYDQACFWVICCVSFWGSFRIGELICDKPEEFSPISDLLGSDVINMSTSSFAFWIRDPKVPKKYGDVVEIWKTSQFPDIDPFQAFSSYWSQRNNKGFLLTQPLFLRANGKPFHHSLFSSTLQSLISHYSLELELSANRWTGHSFRSGLPTLLQSAGFSDEDIKSWGRWASTVFQLYAKDISRRFEVQRSILNVMDKLKAIIDKN